MDSGGTRTVDRVVRAVGGVSLVLGPLGLAIGWALNYRGVGDFFTFDLSSPYTGSGKSSSAEQFLATITGADGGFRYLLLPHYFIYAAMPVIIAAVLYLAFLLYRAAPWRAVIGAALTTIGAVYFVGVLGAWLSFPVVGSVSPDEIADLGPVVRALTTVQGVLLVSTGLSVLVFVGLIVLASALTRGGLLSRWSAIAVITGNALILAFAGTENWMTIGALVTATGFLPLTVRTLRGNPAISPRRVSDTTTPIA